MSDTPAKPGDYTIRQTTDLPLCYCFNVKEQAVVAAIQTKKLKTVREVQTATSAGCGCGCCQPDIQTLLEQSAKGEPMGIKVPVIEARDAKPPMEIPPPKI
ncbi:MAG: (2Fe-2S)-binding protein [Planctomycetota bacterium]|nr:(2Fe-2S)-binding protein [Planctomycetota bacterium]